jgi:hypothetical protein
VPQTGAQEWLRCEGAIGSLDWYSRLVPACMCVMGYLLTVGRDCSPRPARDVPEFAHILGLLAGPREYCDASPVYVVDAVSAPLALGFDFEDTGSNRFTHTCATEQAFYP